MRKTASVALCNHLGTVLRMLFVFHINLQKRPKKLPSLHCSQIFWMIYWETSLFCCHIALSWYVQKQARKLQDAQAVKLTSWKADKLTGWQIQNLTNWKAAGLTRWQDDKMTGWQVDKLTGWQVGRITINQNGKITRWHDSRCKILANANKSWQKLTKIGQKLSKVG